MVLTVPLNGGAVWPLLTVANCPTDVELQVGKLAIATAAAPVESVRVVPENNNEEERVIG